MEEIPLNEPASPLAQGSDPDPAWVDAYRKLMNESVRTADMLFLSNSWRAYDDDPERSGIKLYEASYGESQGYVALKAHAILPVRAERLMWVLRDHDEGTRLRWDGEHVKSVAVVERMMVPAQPGDAEQLRIVQSRVDCGIPMVWPRTLLGLEWQGYNRASRVYKYVFRTTQHRSVVPAPLDSVAVRGLIAALVRVIEPARCELILVLHVNPGDSFRPALANICKPWLRTRVALYQRVVENWNTYYGQGRVLTVTRTTAATKRGQASDDDDSDT